MLKNKIKGLLSSKGKKQIDYANQLQITTGSLSRKFKENSYNIKDLIVLAELTNTELQLVDKETKDMLFTINREDIE